MIADELVSILGFKLKGEHNLRKFTQGMGVAAKRAQAFARTIGIAGAAAGAAAAAMAGTVFRMTDTVARDLDAIGKVSDKVGMNVEQLQQFRYAASQMAGVTQQTADMALQRFARRIGEAANGGGELKATIDALGIELRNADGSLKSTHTLLGEFADAVAGAKSEQEALAYVFKAFDSEGGPLVTMMRQGSDAMKAAEKQAIGLGLIMSQDAVEASTKFNDAQDRSRRILEAFRRMVAVELLPTFTSWMDRFQGFWKESIANGSVDRWATQISDAILAVFDAIRSFGVSGAAVLDFIKNLTGAKSRVQAFLIALAGISAIVAPWTTAVVVIALLIEDLIKYLQGGESVIGDVIKAIQSWFDGLWQAMTPQIDFIKKEWEAITSAIEAALQPFERFIEGFRERLAEFDMDGLFGRMGDAFSDLGKAFRELGDGIVAVGAAINDLFAKKAGEADFAAMVGEFAEFLGRLVASGFVAQLNLVVGTVKAFGIAVQGLADALQLFAQGEFMAGFESIGQAILDVANEVIETLARMIDAFFPDLGVLAKWEDLKAGFEGLVEWAQDWVNRINALFEAINWPQPPQWWRDLVGANEEAKAGAAVGAAIVQPLPQAQEQAASQSGTTTTRGRLSRPINDRIGVAENAPVAGSVDLSGPLSELGTALRDLADLQRQRIAEQSPDYLDDMARISAVFQDFAARTTPEAATEMIANDNRVDSRDQSVHAPVTVNQTLTTVQQMAPSAAKAAGRNTGNAVAQQSRVAAEPAR